MDMKKIQIGNQGFGRAAKFLAFAVCFIVLSSLAVAPLHASISSARDLSGTWQSSSSGTYYEMDAFGTGIRQADVTGTFSMDVTQDSSQITIALYLNPVSWVVDPAFTQAYGSDVTGAPPVAGEIDFSGTVSSSSFTAQETGSQLTSEQLVGTFTTDIITATLSGTAEDNRPKRHNRHSNKLGNSGSRLQTPANTPPTTNAATRKPLLR